MSMKIEAGLPVFVVTGELRDGSASYFRAPVQG